MITFPNDLSDEVLISAIRGNLYDFFRHLGRNIPEGGFENGKFTRWCTPLPHPWFSGVLCSGLPQEGDEAFIEESLRYFREKKVEVCTWWVEPHLEASVWKTVLSKYGFGFSEDTPGMAVDLQELDDSKAAVEGLEIRTVSDENTMRTWTDIFTRGYGLPADLMGLIFGVWTRLGFDFPLRNFLGYLNGEPVSTSTILFSKGIAGIYDVATLPEARGKGIGAALTLDPLLQARKMGYRIGVLQSSEMGYSVYKKLGFRHLCQIENYYRSPE